MFPAESSVHPVLIRGPCTAFNPVWEVRTIVLCVRRTPAVHSLCTYRVTCACDSSAEDTCCTWANGCRKAVASWGSRWSCFSVADGEGQHIHSLLVLLA